MHPIIQKALVTVFRWRNRSQTQVVKSRYALARDFIKLRVSASHLFKDMMLMVAGICSAAFGLESFLIPNGFIDGGATGIALLVTALSEVSLSILLILVNIPFVILGFTIIGRQFAMRAAVAITGLALVVAFVHFPIITQDKVLAAVFGGFFLGAGIGMAVRGGSVLDGTEILALYLSKKLGTTIGDIIILVNVVVFSSAAYLLSWDTALYSMITYLAASRTLDFVIEGIEEYTGITIVSPYSERIREMIIHIMGRGVTVYKGKRGYGSHGDTGEIDIIYTVITRLEISKLNTEIEKIDPNAFVIMSSIKDTKGGMIKKRRHRNQ